MICQRGNGDPKVTVLDFAAGTGTFLVAIFKLILGRLAKHEKGSIESAIKDHLIKKFYGFEYLVAPYALAHLKLSQLLKDHGYYMKENERLKIFLTDTLDFGTLDGKKGGGTKMLPTILAEGTEAMEIKEEKEILVITGNPPYSNRSTGKRIKNLIDYYKPVGERKLNLNDDYIKFIRFAHNKMERTQKGIVGIITNNSFLNGITHRTMRAKLSKDFDEIYISFFKRRN